MNYSIGEVANATGIPISTLRYYDREGLFPKIGRSNGGIRVFSDQEIEAIKIIECLKTSGMPIKDIKQFWIGVRKAIVLCNRGEICFMNASKS